MLYSVPTVKGWCRSYFGIVRPTDSGFGGPDTEHLPPLLLVIAGKHASKAGSHDDADLVPAT